MITEPTEETPGVLADFASDSLDTWAYIEIFGHQKIAGRLTTRKFGTEVMFQVDVPLGEKGFSHTQFFSPKSIFSINPTTEAYCRKFADYSRSYNKEVIPYVPEAQKQLTEPPPETLMTWNERDDRP